MELDYALLAEKADRLQDKRLVIWGGDADSIETTALPALVQMALVARFVLSPEEPLNAHTFGLKVTSPNGETLSIVESSPLNTSRNESEPDLPSGSGLIVNLVIGAKEAGAYVIHLLLDGREVKAMRLRVDLAAPEKGEKEHGLLQQIDSNK